MTNLIHICTLATHLSISNTVDAIYLAEGGAKTSHPYGVMSVKTDNPRQVCAQSVVNNFKRWNKQGCFIDFMADRWCPVKSDQIGNRNWKQNLKSLLKHNDVIETGIDKGVFQNIVKQTLSKTNAKRTKPKK